MDNSKYLKTVIIDKLIENEANMVEDVTIEEARLNLYLNGEKAISLSIITVFKYLLLSIFFLNMQILHI